VAIIHLAHLLPDGSSDLPGGRGTWNLKSEITDSQLPWAGSPFDASLFGLALRGVCLAAWCYHPRRCALTL